MRYDLTLPITNFEGVQLSDAIDSAFTLRSVLVRTALYADKANPLTVLEKRANYAMAKRLATANHFIDLEVTQVAGLKSMAEAMWSTLVAGRIAEVLESPLTELLPAPGLPPCVCETFAQISICKTPCSRQERHMPTADIPAEG